MALLLLLTLFPTAQFSFQSNSIPGFQTRPPSQYWVDDSALDALQNFFRGAMAATEKSFPGKLGKINGFGAGDTYPQIWLRDSATAIPVTRYYYPSQFMTSWLEEHLAHQNRDGSLYDWIASGKKSQFLPGAPRAKEVYRSPDASSEFSISADKNTTEADQETSAVETAYWIFRIIGNRRWLTKNIDGVPLVVRLDRSLRYLLHARFDARHGLITNALTADWGDVSPVYQDQRAIYLDARTPVVVGLYTNVLFCRATAQLSELYAALGQKNRALYWRKQTTIIKRNINRFMWQEDRGFYRMHVQVVSTGNPRFDNSNMFAMGGNGLAVLYEVASDRQAARIFDVAFKRQREFGISTIAGVLLPPYPQGFFRHPAVSEEYTYQNGGQWDWFAGRLLLAEFERGDARRAAAQLSALAAKAKSNGGLFEWHTRDGKGMGSPNFVGSAGALAAALYQGLFGVYLSANSLNLKIRLAEVPARVNLFEPATERSVSYEYRYFPDQAKLSLTYQSNVPGLGEICILLPDNTEALQLLRDGNRMEFTKHTIGRDRYRCVTTDWAKHKVELLLSNSSTRGN